MNSHGLGILITGCVREMVHDPNPMPFFILFFIFFYFMCFVLSTTGNKDGVER